MAVLEFTTGEMGVGKSYSRVAWLVDEYLRDPAAKVWTNIHLEFDAIAPVVCKATGESEEELRERIRVIPEEEMLSLRKLGPLEWLEEQPDINGVHFMIDEAQNFFGRNRPKKIQTAWADWFSEVRHEGATVEAMSTGIKNFDREITDLSGFLRTVSNFGDEPEPIFGIPLDDVFQVEAAFRGRYYGRQEVYEYRRTAGKEKLLRKLLVQRNPQGFKYYDSHSASSGGRQGTGRKQPWERLGRKWILFWFLRRNIFRIIANRNTMFVCLMLFMLSGGTQYMFRTLIDIPQKTGATSSQNAASNIGPDGRKLRPTLAAPRAANEPVRQAKSIVTEDGEEGPPLPIAVAVIDGVMTGAASIDGATVRTGEQITGGYFDGQKLLHVDTRRRRVLIGNEWLPLGIVSAPADSDAAYEAIADRLLLGSVQAGGVREAGSNNAERPVADGSFGADAARASNPGIGNATRSVSGRRVIEGSVDRQRRIRERLGIGNPEQSGESGGG